MTYFFTRFYDAREMGYLFRKFIRLNKKYISKVFHNRIILGNGDLVYFVLGSQYYSFIAGRRHAIELNTTILRMEEEK